MNIVTIYKIDKIIERIHIYGFTIDHEMNSITLFYERSNEFYKLTNEIIESLDDFLFLKDKIKLYDYKTSNVSLGTSEISFFISPSHIEILNKRQYKKCYLYWNGILDKNFINLRYSISDSTLRKFSKYIDIIFIEHAYYKNAINILSKFKTSDKIYYTIFLNDI